jgi:glycosyltransferase involved in cell wall biosynthesis
LHESLCRQDYLDFEWILVDDFSSDDTFDLLKGLSAPGEGGISVYKLPQNSGGGVALGFGVSKCRGDIVIMIDHDDELVDSAFATIISEWSKVENRPEIAGIFYRRLDPVASKVIGGYLQPGMEFSMSWQTNTKPDITDGFLVFKSEIAKNYFNPQALESICLSGVPLQNMAKKYNLLAGQAEPLLIYHRDNPASQTNLVKISRKTVFTYAKYIDAYDVHYFRRPIYWIRHIVALIKFSIAVHGNPIFHHRFIESYAIRVLSFLLLPLGFLSYLRSKKKTVVIDIPVFDLSRLAILVDVKS